METVTLHQLSVFTEVCALGSFTQAADKLNVAQPALSRQIKNLEDRLGVILLDRSARPLKPTPRGQVILRQAHDVLNAARRLVNTARQQSGQRKRSLIIGFVGSALIGALPKALKSLHAELPNVEISMLEYSSTEQVEALKNGQIHIGFGRILFDDSQIRQIVLKREPLVAAAAHDSDFATQHSVSLAERISREIVLSYPRTPAPNYAQQVRTGLRANGFAPKETRVLADLQSALSLAEAGMGVAIVPASICDTPRPGLTFVDIAELNMTSPITVNCPLQAMEPDAQILLEKVQALSGD